MIKIKVQFGDSLEPILSASTASLFSVFTLSDQSIALRAPAVHGVSSYKGTKPTFMESKTQEKGMFGG